MPHLCRSDGASESGNDFGSGLVLGTRISGAAAGKHNSKSDRFHVVHLAPTPDSNDDEDSTPGWHRWILNWKRNYFDFEYISYRMI